MLHIYDRIAARAGVDVASRCIDRLEAFCLGFDLAAERGTRRDDVRTGLRTVGFERRITIAFAVDDETVTFLRFFHGGRNWESEFQAEAD